MPEPYATWTAIAAEVNRLQEGEPEGWAALCVLSPSRDAWTCKISTKDGNNPAKSALVSLIQSPDFPQANPAAGTACIVLDDSLAVGDEGIYLRRARSLGRSDVFRLVLVVKEKSAFSPKIHTITTAGRDRFHSLGDHPNGLVPSWPAVTQPTQTVKPNRVTWKVPSGDGYDIPQDFDADDFCSTLAWLIAIKLLDLAGTKDNLPGLPIATVIRRGRAIIAWGINFRSFGGTFHGEVTALQSLPDGDYSDCILHSTLRPCEMCAGLIQSCLNPRSDRQDQFCLYSLDDENIQTSALSKARAEKQYPKPMRKGEVGEQGVLSSLMQKKLNKNFMEQLREVSDTSIVKILAEDRERLTELENDAFDTSGAFFKGGRAKMAKAYAAALLGLSIQDELKRQLAAQNKIRPL